MKKLKVLHVIKSLGRGGAEMLLPETLKLHDQEQFEFHYIYFLPWKNQLVESIREAGGVVTCFSARNNIQIMLQALRVSKYIKKHDIQLLHCHLPWAGFLGRLIHYFCGTPMVYTEHNKQERYHRITFMLNKISFNKQNRVIAVSEDVASSIKKNIAPNIPIEVILNGVNTESFLRDENRGTELRNNLSLPENAIIVGTIAVFRFQKRLVEWLEVMSVVCKENPNVYGIIVGDGPLKSEILEKRGELGLEKRVIMPGLETNVKPWLSAMDIYMMSSVFEGLPIALLEAMSMSCAVVTTDAGGIKEVITHNETGLMVPVDNWEQLKDLLTKIVKDESLRLSIASAARQRVQGAFSLKKMIENLELLYKQTIN